MAFSNRVSNGTVFGIGVLAGAVMIFALWLARVVELADMNMSMILGSMFTAQTGGWTWLLGFTIHLALSGAFALIYANVFRSMRRAGTGLGVRMGIAHWAAGGLLIGLVPFFHVLMPEVISEPGFFAVQRGLGTALTFFVLHMIYGGIVGGLYANAAEQVPERRTQPRLATSRI